MKSASPTGKSTCARLSHIVFIEPAIVFFLNLPMNWFYCPPGNWTTHIAFLVQLNYDSVLRKLFLDEDHLFCSIDHKISTWRDRRDERNDDMLRRNGKRELRQPEKEVMKWQRGSLGVGETVTKMRVGWKEERGIGIGDRAEKEVQQVT